MYNSKLTFLFSDICKVFFCLLVFPSVFQPAVECFLSKHIDFLPQRHSPKLFLVVFLTIVWLFGLNLKGNHIYIQMLIQENHRQENDCNDKILGWNHQALNSPHCHSDQNSFEKLWLFIDWVNILINNFNSHIIFNSHTETDLLYSVYTCCQCYSFYVQFIPSLGLSSNCSLLKLTSFIFFLNTTPNLSCELLEPNSSWSFCYSVIKSNTLLKLLLLYFLMSLN